MNGASRYGIKLTDAAIDSFIGYFAFLEEKSKIMNLTAIKSEKDAAELHFLDCLALIMLEDFENKSIIDIGSGAGFPGMPLKLAEPSISLTLLDSQQKRIVFLVELCNQLGLTDIEYINARAEEASREPGIREAYDYSVSRAVARLNILCELCLPFVKPGGKFIAMKGANSEQEISEAKTAAEKLGAEIENSFDYEIPGTDVVHRAVILRKLKPTPAEYPRRFARIQNKPL